MNNTFTCSLCQHTFEKEWTEDEAVTELVETFGHLPAEDLCVVCDDCYQAVMA